MLLWGALAASLLAVVGLGANLLSLRQLFWDRQRNLAIVHGFRLKPVSKGHAYQLWFIKDGKPVPSITLKPESTGHVRIERIPVPSDGSLSAAAVTVEPESGSLQPTSPILLVGPLTKS